MAEPVRVRRLTDQEGQKLQQIVRRGSTSMVRYRRAMMLPIYVILDNLSAHKNWRNRAWAKKNKVELCFTATYASWANPIEAHFGPLRQFTIANSDHPNHTVQTRALHAYLRGRNANARHPDVLTAQRRERARVRSEKGIRWGGRLLSAAACPPNPRPHGRRAHPPAF